VTGRPARNTGNTLIGFVFALLALLLPLPSLAQITGSSLTDQLQLFNSLTPAQQQAIMQRLGQGATGTTGLGGLGGLGSTSGLGAGSATQRALLQNQAQEQRRQLELQQQDQEALNLKPGDTVLIDIAMPGDQRFAQMLQQSALQAQIAQGTLGFSGAAIVPAGGAGVPAVNSGQNVAASARAQEQPAAPQEQLEAMERQRLEDMVTLIRSRNPYQLDRDGNLVLPGFPAIALAGLTEELATRRVAAVPALDKLQLRLTRLPLQKTGMDGLKAFGYDIFNGSSLSFMPTTDIPVPADYIIGPGDLLEVQLFGSTNQTLNLIVSRDGTVSFPQIGPINVGGQRFNAAKADIETRVARQMIGTRASVSMSETRAINVFVLGEARYPGSYSVSGLATVTSALFAAGGITSIGSLRTVQVVRQGGLVRTLDLYDLLMRGDSSGDVKLLPGDVVFIPPVGSTVSVAGEVQRPAIYELKGGNSVSDLLQMAGGLTTQADHSHAALERVDEQQKRVVMDVDLGLANSTALGLRNGDSLRVSRLRPTLDSGVTLQGYVYRPGSFAWREGLRLTDVIHSIDELKPNADENYVLVRRELPPNRRVAVFSADLTSALRSPGSATDITLMPRDTITVFDLQTSRERVIAPLMDELRLQANLADPTEIVHVEGRVKVPGDYPLEPGMRVSDLIRAGGSLESSAYGSHAELSRYTVAAGAQRQTQVIDVDLAAVRAGDKAADVVLQPYDRLSIKEVSGWTEQAQVVLRGEVRFPGTYSVKRGETLRSVIARAGGLTDLAFPDGAVFTRRELRDREQEQLDRLALRLRSDIAEMALMGARAGQGGSAESISIGEGLLTQLTGTKAVGRLVIDLDTSMRAKPGTPEDIILRDGDELIVPKQRQEVMVLGEVQSPSSHLYRRGLERDDYVEQSGGITRQADKSKTYVVRADGSVQAGGSRWFRSGVNVRPGDAIVVPLDTQKLPPLPTWQAVTQILYNIAISVAAIHAL
jgi:protein involved in polysaccharide export with SLBB domain